MLSKLLNTIKRGSRKIGERGYTLIEVAAVVAVTAVLAAVVIPVAMGKIQESKETAALKECQQIGAAIAGFFKDTTEWPAYSTATRNYFQVLRSGPTNTNATDPLASANVPQNWGATIIDHLENHLVVDNPAGTLGGTPNAAYLKTHKLNWKGPYVESLTKRDPWGNNYLVLVNAMQLATTGPDKMYGWIISAGSNAKLETKATDNKLGGDDIGFYLYAAETGH